MASQVSEGITKLTTSQKVRMLAFELNPSSREAVVVVGGRFEDYVFRTFHKAFKSVSAEEGDFYIRILISLTIYKGEEILCLSKRPTDF